MPSLPKWINDTVENVWSSKFKDCTVTEIKKITDHLCCIRFAADLQDVHFEPAYAIGIRVNDRDFRNYSPFNFNTITNTFDVLFHLHDHEAAGNSFVNQLARGHSVKILMPRGKRFFEPDTQIHFSIGDETSLGSSLSIQQAAEELKQTFVCLHELDTPAVLEELGLYGYHTPKNNTMDIIEVLTGFLKEEKQAVDHDQITFYLTGNGTRMPAVRNFLKAKGVSSRCIRSQAYWIKGKKGL